MCGGEVESENLGGATVFESHLEGSELTEADAVTVTLSCELKHTASEHHVVEIAADAVPSKRSVDAKAQAGGGDGCRVCRAGYLKQLRSTAGGVLTDTNAGNRCGKIPMLF